MNQPVNTAPAPRHPRRWKVWLMMVCGIYPTITLLTYVTTPLLGWLPTPVRLGVLVPMTVAVMVWLVLPRTQRILGAWLTR